MKRAQSRRSGGEPATARGRWRRLPEVAGALLLGCCLLIAFTVPAAARDGRAITPADLEAGFAEIDRLGAFFGAFAERDTNAIAQERWRRLSDNYRGSATMLRGLLAEDALIIDDLPEGRVSALLDDGRIVIDRGLDGQWREENSESDRVVLRDHMLPALMTGLARRYLSQDWPWLADHLRAVGGLAELARDPLARPLLARFFQAKDAYLWLAMQRIAQGDPPRRQALAGRQADTAEAVRALRVDIAATFGAAPADRLRDEWSAYVAQVDGYAATRGWLLLDPALRLTQLGAEAEADAVDLAAAEMLAEAPRSSLAAARARTGPPSAATVAPPAPGVNLGEIVTQAGPRAQLGPAAAAGVVETVATVQRVAIQEAELSAARTALAGLQARVEELHRALQARTAESVELEASLLAARERVAAAERRAAEQAATAEALSAEVRQLEEVTARLSETEERLAARSAEAARLEAELAAERTRLAEAERQRAAAADALARETTAREAAAREAEEAARQAEAAAAREAEAVAAAAQPAAPAAGDEELSDVLSRIEQRQLYLAAAVAVVFLLATMMWLRGRRRTAAAEATPAPLLLTSVAEPVQAPAVMPERPVIDVPEMRETPETEPETAPELPRVQPVRTGERIKVSGVAPLGAEAEAAMKAGRARAQASRAASQAAFQGGGSGSEADAAMHPMVRALRQGNLPFFELQFSELTGLRAPRLQRVVYGGQGEGLTIACRAVGVDKLLFGSIYLLTDQLRGGDAGEDEARMAQVLELYDRMPPATARKVLAKWQRKEGEAAAPPGEEGSLG